MNNIDEQQTKANELEKELKNINFQIKKLSKVLNAQTNITLNNYQQELKELATKPIDTSLNDIIKVITNNSNNKEKHQNITSNIIIQPLFEYYIERKKIVKHDFKKEQNILFKMKKQQIYNNPCYKIGLENHFIEEIKNKHNKFKFTGSANLQYDKWRKLVIKNNEIFPTPTDMVESQLLYHKVKTQWKLYTFSTLDRYYRNGDINKTLK